jgi:hypothetical protein
MPATLAHQSVQQLVPAIVGRTAVVLFGLVPVLVAVILAGRPIEEGLAVAASLLITLGVGYAVVYSALGAPRQ